MRLCVVCVRSCRKKKNTFTISLHDTRCCVRFQDGISMVDDSTRD